MGENKEILNLSNQKKELFNIRTKLSYWKVLQRISIGNRKGKKEILMNKPIDLGLSILELSKILMYGFWYDYVKLKYCKQAKLCYMGKDSFTVYIKTDYIYKAVTDNVDTRFHTSNYELERPLSKEK